MSNLKVLTTAGDLTDEAFRSQLVTKTVDTFGQLDILVSGSHLSLRVCREREGELELERERERELELERERELEFERVRERELELERVRERDRT